MSEPLVVTTTVDSNPERQAWADRFGMLASIGCAIHCAAMPLVLAYLPSLGLGWLAGEGFHRWMAFVCFALAAAAFLPGWRKHRSLAPLVWGACGLLLLTYAAFGIEGGCCPSCTNEQITSCDDNCSLCHAESTSVGDPVVVESNASLVSFPTFLITPFGGLLLVIGHISNHRKSCNCQGSQCCMETTDSELAE